eukprot:6191255-Pleurochrysis_carterae.AAC.3
MPCPKCALVDATSDFSEMGCTLRRPPVVIDMATSRISRGDMVRLHECVFRPRGECILQAACRANRKLHAFSWERMQARPHPWPALDACNSSPDA